MDNILTREEILEQFLTTPLVYIRKYGDYRIFESEDLLGNNLIILLDLQELPHVYTNYAHDLICTLFVNMKEIIDLYGIKNYPSKLKLMLYNDNLEILYQD